MSLKIKINTVFFILNLRPFGGRRGLLALSCIKDGLYLMMEATALGKAGTSIVY